MWFRTLRCSFCRRSDKQVEKLVAGRRGYICDTCAYETIRIMEGTHSVNTAPGARAAVPHQRASDWNRTWHFATTHD
jgi:ATP-dependent protease Clp ATPase subunit